uniref:C-type lectin domain-containing protein n=1 Tax=Gouania willdenowi TaxID=441366 RepID=A0A8C5EQU0_GOUWI
MFLLKLDILFMLIFSSWCPNEPNNGSGKEDCGEYIPSKDCWNDHNCFHLNFWICEKKKA